MPKSLASCDGNQAKLAKEGIEKTINPFVGLFEIPKKRNDRILYIAFATGKNTFKWLLDQVWFSNRDTYEIIRNTP